MKLTVLLGAVAVVIVGFQASQAATLPGTNVREENKQVIIGWEGAQYDSSAPTRVYTGYPHELTNVVVPLWQAIELQLDQLDERHIRLMEVITDPSSTSDPPWPLAGHIQFHEKGWFQMGARCPTVTPQTTAAIEDLYDTVLPGDDDRLGLLNSTVSEYPTNEIGSTVQSAIEYWRGDQDPVTADPADTWWYAGWTVEAGFLIDYYCRQPTGAKGLVFHESYATPYADRTDV